MINLSGLRKTPILRQSEAAECGLACVGMIASHYGHKFDMPSLRRRFSISMKGATLETIANVATNLNFSPRAIRCELEELRELRCPAILHWNLSHYVVLVKSSGREIVVHDPAHGKVKMGLEKASRHFTGVAMELRPTEQFQKKKEKLPLKLSNLIRPDRVVWKALSVEVST